MQIIDLTKEYEPQYFVCLEEWSADMKESGCHKENWYRAMREKGLRVKLALDDAGTPVGMIEYLPVEHSPVQGQSIYFITCIWVHGHKQGIGDQRKQGYGAALLHAAEEDVRSMGLQGIAAQGISLPFWIPASFYKKHGYQTVDKQGIMKLLFKAFVPEALPPTMIKPDKASGKQHTPGKVTVTYYLTGCCPASNIVYERAKRAAAAFGDAVDFRTVDTSDRGTHLACGVQNVLYIDGKKAGYGPPLTYDAIHARIAKRVRKLRA